MKDVIFRYLFTFQAYVPTETLPENMRSLYSKDFAFPTQDKCPARVFIENNAHPRFKHLSD